MDMLTMQLLQLFISNENILTTSLEKKFHISKGNLAYQIQILNQELETHHLGQVKKMGFFSLLMVFARKQIVI